jgi:hypothetical protein
MTMLKGVVSKGRIELDEPLNLPDGTVLMIPLPNGKLDDDEPMTQEEIDRQLALMDQMEPLQMTDEEIAAWEAERKAQREWDKSHFFERAKKLEKMWQ